MIAIHPVLARILVTLKRPTADPSTEAGRLQRRHRRLALNAMASAAAKVVSVLAALISVPLTLHYLGTERYGMWMTMTSLITMLAVTDLGMGNGILSLVASANGRDDHRAIRRHVSCGLFALTLMALLILGALTLSYAWVPWAAFFQVSTPLAQAEAGPMLAAFVVIFALNLPLSVATRTLMGLQKGFAVSLWQCVGNVLGLIGMLTVIHLQGSLLALVIAFAGGPLLAMVGNNLRFFRQYKAYRPCRTDIRWDDIKHIAHTGVLFLVLQLVSATAFTSDNFLITQVHGAAAVPAYAVPEKMFNLIAVTLTMLMAPLWPAYGEAIARGDALWVRKTLIRSLKLAAGSAAALSFVLVLVGPTLLDWWVGAAVEPPYSLLLGLGVWKIIEASGNALANFLNGARVMGLQIATATLTAVLAVGFKLGALHLYSWTGLPWAMSAAFLLGSLLPCAAFVPRILKTIGVNAQNNSPGSPVRTFP